MIGGGEAGGAAGAARKTPAPAVRQLPVLLHIDLVNGLANDESGLRYVATLNGIDGVVTTRHHLAPLARKLGLMSVVRLFLQDGGRSSAGLASSRNPSRTPVEVLPGVAFLQVAERFNHLPIPCIAGGLIRSADVVQQILAGGCRAISTSNVELVEDSTNSPRHVTSRETDHHHNLDPLFTTSSPHPPRSGQCATTCRWKNS
jgi:glycerol uptake operon antiterminator